MRRTKNGFGGCIRIDSNAYYPILLQYQKNKNKWNVIDPRPEGFSIFGALAREAEAGEVYKKIGIDIITPVSLLRNKTLPPWKEVKSSSGLVNFIQKSFPIALKERCDVTLSGKVSVIEMEESGYWELDGGVLVRHGKTPYRIVNLHFALINKDRETLEYLTKETRSALKEMLDILEREQKQELDMFLVKKLGRAAGRLFTQGVIHGQLNIHYQNVSIVGEFSDFDSSIFLNNYSEIVENIPLPKIEESIMKAHNKFIQSIDKLEKTQKVHIKKVIDFDLAKYSTSKVTDSLEEERLAMFAGLDGNTLGQTPSTALEPVQIPESTREDVSDYLLPQDFVVERIAIKDGEKKLLQVS